MLKDALDNYGVRESTREYRRDETDYDTIGAIERDEMIRNPENVGFNLTGDQLISPSGLKAVAEAQALVESVGEDAAFEQLSEKYGRHASELHNIYDTVVEREMAKIDKLHELLADIPDGASFRVHPYAADSPFSIQHTRHEKDGVEFFSFDPIALEQMRAVYEKVNAGEKPGELTVVMNPYTKEHRGNIPSTQREINAYAQMCISFLSQMGLEENGGSGICLELGNETNVDLNTINQDGLKMFQMEGFADRTNPSEYAHMYATVARSIKERFPNVEIAVAGTALFDDEYLYRVITGVLAESDNGKDLIDKISFHPYRGTVEEGAPTFRCNVCVDSGLSYNEQCQKMSELAGLADAKFDIGEVSFSHARGKTVDLAELHANSAHAVEHGLKSYIWPEWQIIEYE